MTLTLTKDMGANSLAGMTRLEVGASWDTTGGASGGLVGKLKRKKGTDLDLICILMQGADPVRFAGLDSLDPLKDGSVVHSGDNQSGHGEGDDELVTCQLDRVHPNVTGLIFCALAFKPGSSLDKAANVAFKVYDSSDGKQSEVAEIWPSLLTNGNACAVAKATRANASAPWELTVINAMGSVTQGDRGGLLRFALNK